MSEGTTGRKKVGGHGGKNIGWPPWLLCDGPDRGATAWEHQPGKQPSEHTESLGTLKNDGKPNVFTRNRRLGSLDTVAPLTGVRRITLKGRPSGGHWAEQLLKKKRGHPVEGSRVSGRPLNMVRRLTLMRTRGLAPAKTGGILLRKRPFSQQDAAGLS